MRDLARRYTEEAIEALADIMRDGSETASARARAAEAILDRAWGKPVPYEAPATLNARHGTEEMSEAEIDARLKQLMLAMYDDDPSLFPTPHGD